MIQFIAPNCLSLHSTQAAMVEQLAAVHQVAVFHPVSVPNITNPRHAILHYFEFHLYGVPRPPGVETRNTPVSRSCNFWEIT